MARNEFLVLPGKLRGEVFEVDPLRVTQVVPYADDMTAVWIDNRRIHISSWPPALVQQIVTGACQVIREAFDDGFVRGYHDGAQDATLSTPALTAHYADWEIKRKELGKELAP